MQRWLQVATKVVETEFPSWELVQAFRALQLSDSAKANHSSTLDDDIAKLAIIANVADPAALKHELMDVIHHAMQVLKIK